ncbi:uncharacterized protein PgNI_02227 [Pyricularia grisea]|uniref:Uncharacterized protein n=1 Tax=Pyricularia grisea TaxID=148305 RepID=A0A6P8BGR0_PYRGI|nr:uncharacterized protein PgNI_02227 [Pyricularia grisea]TLD16056.1 hypothetical protein PgNI_02227 [Pyricularia grisea]
MTAQTPTVVEQRGGLCADADAETSITVIQHITKNLGRVAPRRDPWVSTTMELSTLVGSTHTTSTGYIYKIDTAGIETTFVDTIALYRDELKRKHPYPNEMEASAYLRIPWSSIMGWSYRGGAYTPNAGYTGTCQTTVLRKRGPGTGTNLQLGSACKARASGAGRTPNTAVPAKSAAGAAPVAPGATANKQGTAARRPAAGTSLNSVQSGRVTKATTNTHKPAAKAAQGSSAVPVTAQRAAKAAKGPTTTRSKRSVRVLG